jgi:hypothetical protein
MTPKPLNLHLGSKINPENFSITFAWNDIRKTITLKNGEDVLKLSTIYMRLLNENNIEFDLSTEK